MEYPRDINAEQNHSIETESSYAFVCIAYFAGLTILAALCSTPAAKSIFTAVPALILDFRFSILDLLSYIRAKNKRRKKMPLGFDISGRSFAAFRFGRRADYHGAGLSRF